MRSDLDEVGLLLREGLFVHLHLLVQIRKLLERDVGVGIGNDPGSSPAALVLHLTLLL